ncbi:alpha/beta-hydrolase [Didymella exigua CBS 183.55]|uniref:Alpha/beta-hydrolase n=1 Tax=Didymella exigua CBS 183.55 TaxID=1150837 RepID=A0A6A5RF00_9PLEO|nr:alpha/beta-hydrolase [Didymella exigua CBS 183.55]KAF1926019.1 alpha/beta-hydrolase [Didymella exigua CBS 183.55]
MRFTTAALSLGGASLISALPAASNDTSTTITLDYTSTIPAAGNSTLGYYKYQNIRFAAAPTGDLRFAAPQWPEQETEVNSGDLADASVACSSAEDCLFMDVWVPANIPEGTKLPVLVWTYGGGFTGGSKAQNTPEGLFNLSTEFIFVSYNYRLGITGLGNGPSYAHEGGTTNVALWDVEHAFKWVQKYIGEFGGDADAVTAMGFSAGGSQTLFQMTRFAGHAEQLFKQAYVMSPGFVPGAGHEHAEAFWQNVSTAVGCDGGHIACVRGVDFDTLTSAASDAADVYPYQFQPRVDGDFVADTYEAQFYQGRFNFTGPLVLSHELHEANSQAYSGVNTTADVSTMLRTFFPSITDAILERALELYPESDYTSPGLRFADMKQHFDLTAHNLAATHAMGNNTWNARVDLSPATHGTDQSYYWYSTYTLTSSSSSTSSTNSSSSSNSTSGSGGPPSGSSGGGMGGGSTSVDSEVAIKMQKYLLSFVLKSDPNALWAEDKLYWPKYNEANSTSGVQLIFNETMSTGEDDLANSKALFWNQALWW